MILQMAILMPQADRYFGKSYSSPRGFPFAWLAPVTLKYSLFHSLICMYDNDHTIHKIPAGEIVETPAPPRVGVVQARYNGRPMKVMAIDLRRFGKRRRLGES